MSMRGKPQKYPNRLFTDEQVIKIRQEFFNRGTFEKYQTYAKSLGMNPNTFFGIVTGHTYRNVGGPRSYPSYFNYNYVRGTILC